MKKIPKIIIKTSRKLRKEMTETEKILWNKLKILGEDEYGYCLEITHDNNFLPI